MIKWTDIHERAEAVVRKVLGRLTERNATGEGGEPGVGDACGRVVGQDVEETAGGGSFVDGAVERIAGRLQSSDYLYSQMRARERYDYKKAYDKLRAMERRRRVARRLGVWGGVAACLAGLGVFAFFQQQEEKRTVAQRFEPVREVKAILVRADGERYRLDTQEQRLEDGQGVSLSADSTGLRYEAKAGAEDVVVDSAVVNTLLVPRGGVYRIALADGTQVWLNSDSRLEYPESFAGGVREVRLQGEAYFDVRSDSLRPFVVRTGLGDVTVLGTEFNVKCYPDEESVVATLVEGSVSFANAKVGDTRLEPGCQLTFDQETGAFRMERVNVRYYVGWKDDVLIFQNERLEDIMRVLSRWYDVTVVFENERVKNLVFSGNLDKYDDISTFFKLFELSSSVRFSVLGDYIYVGEQKE